MGLDTFCKVASYTKDDRNNQAALVCGTVARFAWQSALSAAGTKCEGATVSTDMTIDGTAFFDARWQM